MPLSESNGSASYCLQLDEQVRMTETKRGIDYVATYLYPWACERNQIKRPESIDIDRLRRQLKRKRESFERSFTRIKMTKEHLNEIMASLCEKLKIDNSDLVATHETALVALGIDSNAIPFGLDFLVLQGLGDDIVSEFTLDGFIIRLHAPEELEAGRPISLVSPKGMDFPSLAPETILETISKSPSYEYLMEQRAALAELLHFDDMDDDELRQFATHVRS